MPKSKARTKKGKRKAVAADMRRFAKGILKSGSGKKVVKRAQAIAISLAQAGLSRRKGK